MRVLASAKSDGPLLRSDRPIVHTILIEAAAQIKQAKHHFRCFIMPPSPTPDQAGAASAFPFLRVKCGGLQSRDR